jgi:hypothetical protein
MDECIAENDLMVFGMWDKTQDYAIFHKWGKEEDVTKVMDIMKEACKHAPALRSDVFVSFKYPQFSKQDLISFIENATYFSDWLKARHEV